MRQDAPISFSFGSNWQAYLRAADSEAFSQSRADIVAWLGEGGVSGRSVVDVGSGSGIHSLGFVEGDARRLVSFDYDLASVDATRSLWRRAGSPSHWTVTQGSILDDAFISGLGQFDIVYSWGVLHHTGRMWDAIERAAGLVAPGGQFWISIYQKGPRYSEHLELKQRYNRASKIGKRAMEWGRIAGVMLGRARTLNNPLRWNRRTSRGMDTYHDLVDWLGGLPYEVATPDEITSFCAERGLTAERVDPKPEGGCSTYLFRRTSA